MPSMFSVRDPVQHQALKRPVAQKFSMSSIKAMEPFADECSDIFVRAMRDLQGKPVDLGIWLQWYAFDVIGAITFQRRFGFMEKRQDINGMIGGIEGALKYAGIVGQIPALHGWLMGSRLVSKCLSEQPFVDIPDPLRTIVKVCTLAGAMQKCSSVDIHSLPKTASTIMTASRMESTVNDRASLRG